MTYDLKNKVVIVTGGGSGIGRALCEQFAVAGSKVVVADIDRAATDETIAMLSSPADHHLAVTLDVTRPSSWKSLHEAVQEKFGDCDVLCNNAGVFKVGLLDESPLDDWYLQSRVNIDGVILGCHTFIGEMVRRGEGHIVNTSSLAGLYGCAGMSTYSASKFAATGFTQALREEVSEFGVRVSQLCPGAVDTPINHDIDVPLEDRLIPPEEVAARVVAAVASGENPHFIFTHPEFTDLLKMHFDSVLAEYANQF